MCRYDGRNPIQCRDIDLYLSSTLTPILQDNGLLKTLQGMICSRLYGRARKTLVYLGHHLYALADHGVVSFTQLQLSLRNFHISLTVEVQYKLIEGVT